jgi:anti-anti-sigma regulatory factor
MATHLISAEPLLKAAMERLDGGRDDVMLDLSEVTLLEPEALQAFEQLAEKAREKSAQILVHGVNIRVYKVLKTVRLADQFSFLN